MNPNYRQKSKLCLWQQLSIESIQRKLYTLMLAESLQHLHPHQRIIRRHLMLPCTIFGRWNPSIFQKVPVKLPSASMKFAHVTLEHFLFSGTKSIDVLSATSLFLKRNSDAWCLVSFSGMSLVGATRRHRLWDSIKQTWSTFNIYYVCRSCQLETAFYGEKRLWLLQSTLIWMFLP